MASFRRLKTQLWFSRRLISLLLIVAFFFTLTIFIRSYIITSLSISSSLSLSSSSSSSSSSIVNNQAPKVALILPFIPSQLETLIRQLENLFVAKDPHKLNNGNSLVLNSHIRIILYTDRKLTGLQLDRLYLWFSNSSSYPSQSASTKTLLRNWSIKYADIPSFLADKHPCGPCAMFFRMFHMLSSPPEDKFDYAIVLEPDVFPLRHGWLSILEQEISIGHMASRGILPKSFDFWMKGSVSQCHKSYGNIQKRLDFHLNGNAIFKIGDVGFQEYLDRVRAFYPGGSTSDGCDAGCVTGSAYEGGHDHTLYQFRMNPANFDYVRPNLFRFQITPHIVNYCEDEWYFDEKGTSIPDSSIQDRDIEMLLNVSRSSYYNRRDNNLVERFPDAMLVHSKGPIRDYRIQILRRASIDIKNKYSDYGEEKKVIGNDANLVALILQACQSTTYASRRKKDGYVSNRCERLFCHDLNPKYSFCTNYKNSSLTNWKSFASNKLYLWNVDFHAGPIGCNMDIYKAAGAVVHAEVDFSNCNYYPGTCKSRLKSLSFDKWRGFSLDPCPGNLKRSFYQSYYRDPEMQRIDAVICSHPVANCELFMPFNKTIILYATTRLEFGRWDEGIAWRQPLISSRSRFRFYEWIRALRRIANKFPFNIVAANNLYDAKYIEYFTGVRTIYIPSWCQSKGSNIRYDRSKSVTESGVIFGPYRDNLGHPYKNESEAWNHPIFTQLRKAIDFSYGQTGLARRSYLRMRQVYPHGHGAVDLIRHPCLVLVPYQVSMMSIFEYYRLAIPLYVPSQRLLISWQKDYNLVWERVYGHPDRMYSHLYPEDNFPIVTPAFFQNLLDSNGTKEKATVVFDTFDPCHLKIPLPESDPNNDTHFSDWIGLSDFYQLPHIQTFDNFTHLIDQIELNEANGGTGHDAISNQMIQYNVKAEADITKAWKTVFDWISSNGGKGRLIPDYDEASDALYSVYGLHDAIAKDPNPKCNHNSYE